MEDLFFFAFFPSDHCVPFLLAFLEEYPKGVNVVAQVPGFFCHGTGSVRIIILAAELDSETNMGEKKKVLCVEVAQFAGFMKKYHRNGPANMEQHQHQRLLHFPIAESQANGAPAANSRSSLRGLCLNSLSFPLCPRFRDSMPPP